MIENPKVRRGMISEKRAELHFLSQGYSVCWPALDNGFDLLIHKEESCFLRVQVKTAGKEHSPVRLLAAGKKHGNVAAMARVAASQPRHYDILMLVGDEYVWVIPEEETRGITGIDPNFAKSKWTKFREERLDGRRP